MKLEKISNNVLYAVCALIVLVFGLFFGWDYSTETDARGNVIPRMTDLLMILMYLMGIVTFILMVGSLVMSAMKSAGNDEKESTGIPGTKVTICTAVITLAAFAAGYLLNLNEEAFTTASGDTTSAGMITIVDAFMVSIYVLSLVSVISVVVSSTGIMTKSATKR